MWGASSRNSILKFSWCQWSYLAVYISIFFLPLFPPFHHTEFVSSRWIFSPKAQSFCGALSPSSVPYTLRPGIGSAKVLLTNVRRTQEVDQLKFTCGRNAISSICVWKCWECPRRASARQSNGHFSLSVCDLRSHSARTHHR